MPAPPNATDCLGDPIVAGDVVQLVPLYNSVAPVAYGLPPPKANPAVCVPVPPKEPLAVFKFPPAVQAEPSYSSVTAVKAGTDVIPPNAKPAV